MGPAYGTAVLPWHGNDVSLSLLRTAQANVRTWGKDAALIPGLEKVPTVSRFTPSGILPPIAPTSPLQSAPGSSVSNIFHIQTQRIQQRNMRLESLSFEIRAGVKFWHGHTQELHDSWQMTQPAKFPFP